MTFKIKISHFINKLSTNHGNGTKSEVFHGIYSNLMLFFIGRKMLKYFNFNGFYNWDFSISMK